MDCCVVAGGVDVHKQSDNVGILSVLILTVRRSDEILKFDGYG